MINSKLEIVTLYGGNKVAKWCGHYRAFIGFKPHPDSFVLSLLENVMPHGDKCNALARRKPNE